MVNHGEKFWEDGQLRDWASAGTISLLTHTLHYGLGAFEGIRAYRRRDGGSVVFRLGEHVNRLFDSCRLALIEPRVTREQVETGCLEVLRANRMAEGYLRPLVILGAGSMGLLPKDNAPKTYVMVWEWGAYLGADGLEKGIRCKISSYAR